MITTNRDDEEVRRLIAWLSDRSPGVIDPAAERLSDRVRSFARDMACGLNRLGDEAVTRAIMLHLGLEDFPGAAVANPSDWIDAAAGSDAVWAAIRAGGILPAEQELPFEDPTISAKRRAASLARDPPAVEAIDWFLAELAPPSSLLFLRVRRAVFCWRAFVCLMDAVPRPPAALLEALADAPPGGWRPGLAWLEACVAVLPEVDAEVTVSPARRMDARDLVIEHRSREAARWAAVLINRRHGATRAESSSTP